MTVTLPPPPKSPRPLTAVVSRRTLMEPRVRAWWLAGFVLLGISAFFAINRFIQWNHVRWLINHGIQTTAVIWQIGDPEEGLRSGASPDNKVYMSLDYGGQKIYVEGYLDGYPGTLNLNDSIPIRVDPAEPTSWTYRTTPPPLLGQMFSVALVGVPAVVCLIAAFMLRGQVLRIWTDGVAQEFAVVSSHQTAAAPLSRVVHCTALDGTGKEPIKVFVPMRLADPLPGQLIWLIYPSGKPSAAIPAMAYV